VRTPRVVTAAEAVAGVRNGDVVFVASAAATPSVLLKALYARAATLVDVTLLHFITDGLLPNDDPAFVSPFVHRALFIGREMRALLERGCAVDYVPMSIAQVPRLVAAGRLRADVSLIQTSRPDAEGRLRFGVGVDIAAALVAKARLVATEANARMPLSDSESLALSDVDFAVETDHPLPEYRHPASDEVTRQVARYIVSLIEDGSTLQVGVGQIPNEALRFLHGRRHLGIHSDLITDTVLDLIDAGIVDNSAKSMDRGRVVASYCFGTRRLYDRIGRDAAFVFRSIDRVCDPAIIALQHRMVSISQVFSVDLTGQACSDQFEGELYGGVSAQPDLLRATAAAPGGKSIICLASTTVDHAISRIRPLLREGEGVTLSRADVHYVVTEYGIANLFGKSIRERALALIEISHPDFRPWLLEEAKRLGYLPALQSIASQGAYPVEEERSVMLKDGVQVSVRPARASDADAMRALFHDMSQEDVYTRFFSRLACLSFLETQRLCNVDYANEVAFVVWDPTAGDGDFVATASYYRDTSTRRAEVAYMIRPDWQGRGLGRALQDLLFDYGKRHGIERFVAEVLRTNRRMVQLASAACKQVDVEREDDTVIITMTP